MSGSWDWHTPDSGTIPVSDGDMTPRLFSDADNYLYLNSVRAAEATNPVYLGYDGQLGDKRSLPEALVCMCIQHMQT